MDNITQTNGQSQETFDVDLSGLEQIQVGTADPGSQNSNVHTNNDGSQEIEIDPRFKDLDPNEGRLRTLQSQRDTTEANYNKLLKDFDERDRAAQLFDQMFEDEGLLMAFINEVKPDLIRSRDVAAELKGQLKKEFGEDFKPQLTREEAERDDPFGNDAKYYMRLDDLKQQLKVGGQAPQSVKDYIKAREMKRKADEEKYDVEKQTVKAQKKMTDDELKAVSDWAMKLKFAEIVDIHRFLRKVPSRNPNITNAPGGGETTKSERTKWLDAVMPIR